MHTRAAIRRRTLVSLAVLTSCLTTARAGASLSFAYSSFQIGVQPRYIASNHFLVDIVATNVSSDTFETGELTVSLSGDTYLGSHGDAVGRVKSFSGTSARQVPPGSRLRSPEGARSTVSSDPVFKVQREEWKPDETVNLKLNVEVSRMPFELRLRVHGALAGGENRFEPVKGRLDQEGFNTETWAMERPPTRIDLDGDGREEVIVEWNTGEYGSLHRYQVFATDPPQRPLVGQFDIVGMYQSRAETVFEPDPSYPTKAVLRIQFNALSSSYYVVRNTGMAVDLISIAVSDRYEDLDGDGQSEWLLFQKFDEMRHENRLGFKAKAMTIFRWDPASERYTLLWPEPVKDYALVGGVVVDADRDGKKEVVALIDSDQAPGSGRHLAVFKLDGTTMRRVVDHALPSKENAADIRAVRYLDDKTQIVLKCNAEGGWFWSAYDYVNGSLEHAWGRKNLEVLSDLQGLWSPVIDDITAADVIFSDVHTGERVELP